MTEDTRFGRRSVLKTIGGAVGLGVVGGAGLLATTSPAAAQSFTIKDSGVLLDDGQVSYISVNVGGNLTWDGFDVPVERLRFVSEVQLPNITTDPTGWYTLSDSTSDVLGNWSGDGDSNGWGGDGEYVVEDDGTHGEVHTNAFWNVIGDPNATDPANGGPRSVESPAPWQSEVSVDSDDTTKDRVVEKRSTVYFLDANEKELNLPPDVQQVQETATFTVSVTNEDSTTGGSTSGSSDGG